MRKTKNSEPKTNIVRKNGRITFRQKSEFLIETKLLSDDEWNKISGTTELPDDARLLISAHICDYRRSVAADKSSLTTKRRVARMRLSIEKLRSEADDLLKDPVFFEVGLPFWSSRTGPLAQDITARLIGINELDQILADAQDRLKKRPGRKSSQPLDGLIKELMWLAARVSGEAPKRSMKLGFDRPTDLYIRTCALIADPNLPESAINNALTKVIAERNQILRDEGFDIATGTRT